MAKLIKIAAVPVFLLLILGSEMVVAQPVVVPPKKTKLIVGVTMDPPYLMKLKNGEWSGMAMDIWEFVAQTMNVDYELKELNFKEIFDSLHDGTVDVVIEPLFVTPYRQKTIDFTYSFGSSRLAVASLPDKISHPWMKAIHIIFSWGTLEVLGFLLGVLFLLGFILWRIERKHNPDHFGGGTVKGLGSGIYWVGSTLAAGVCFGVSLKSITARILGLVWMLTCALAISALIASLSASLTASRSMADVIDDETLQGMHLGALKDTSWEKVMKGIGGNYTLYPVADEIIPALFDGRIDGFLYDEITLNYLAKNEYKGRISVFPTDLKRRHFAFGLPQNSPYRREINYALLTLIDKPEWPVILKKYGLEDNFDAKKILNRRRR